MSIFKKIKWIAGVLLVFLVVLATNLIDKDNFDRLKESVVTIYEDRVVTSNLIFEMAILMQEKEMALATSDSDFFQKENDKANKELEELIVRYQETKLTSSEQEIFNNLKREMRELWQLEKKYLNDEPKTKIRLFESIDDIVHDLYNLSKVQLEEGERQMKLSNKTMQSIDLFTQIEIIFLILMAVVVQIIILYYPKKE